MRHVRRRIALLVPSTNSTAEPDFHMAIPDGVTVHSHRLWLGPNGSDPSAIDMMNSELTVGARYLSALRPDVICMAGTTNSFYRGLADSHRMEEEMSRAAGVPAVSSSPSVAQALRHYRAKRISVATPYPSWNNDRLRDYFISAGFDVLNVDGDPRVAHGNSRNMNDQDPSEILEFAVSICRPEADAVFCACSAWRALEVVSEIEAHIGRPVITTNQATMWRTLSKIGIHRARKGYGHLLDEMPTIEDPTY